MNKTATTLEQSSKLAEFLPIESADQTWARIAIAGANLDVPEELQYRHNGDMPFQYYSGIGTPCWSLAALLDIINKDYYTTLFHDGVSWTITITHHDDNKNRHSVWSAEPLDACYDMIIKLKAQNLI